MIYEKSAGKYFLYTGSGNDIIRSLNEHNDRETESKKLLALLNNTELPNQTEKYS